MTDDVPTLEPKTAPDGTTVFVTRKEGERGSKGAFFVAYLSRDQNERYGWFCGNCETFDNAMDTMGRIKCNHCGNIRKPTEWDAAHE